MHQADTLRLLGTDGAPGQDQLERACFADDARQALGAPIAWDHAELDLGEPQFGVRRGEAEREDKRKLEATAEGVAVDDGNRRDRQRAELGKDRLAALETAPVRGGSPGAETL